MKRKRGMDWEELELLSREDRIGRLKDRARELAGGEMSTFTNPEAPPEIIEQFWKQVVRFEEAERGMGPKLPPVQFPDPTGLTDQEVTELLWKKIEELAGRRIFLEQTDHLSDRELYEVLRTPEMRELTTQPVPANGAVHFDILGGFSEEDIQLYLKYYADELDRASWHQDWPDDELPPKEEPPFQRDWGLPKPSRPEIR